MACTGAFGGGSGIGAADATDGDLDVVIIPAGSRVALVRRAWGLRTQTIERQRAGAALRGAGGRGRAAGRGRAQLRRGVRGRRAGARDRAGERVPARGTGIERPLVRFSLASDDAVGAAPLRLAQRLTGPRDKASPHSPPGAPTATPTDTVRPSRAGACERSSHPIARRRARGAASSVTTNSSAPIRNAWPPAGVSSRSSPAVARRTSSPAAWPRSPLISPGRRCRRARPRRARRSAASVQAGQRVARDTRSWDSTDGHPKPVGRLQREQLEQLDVLERRAAVGAVGDDDAARARSPAATAAGRSATPTPARRSTSWPAKPRPGGVADGVGRGALVDPDGHRRELVGSSWLKRPRTGPRPGAGTARRGRRPARPPRTRSRTARARRPAPRARRPRGPPSRRQPGADARQPLGGRGGAERADLLQPRGQQRRAALDLGHGRRRRPRSATRRRARRRSGRRRAAGSRPRRGHRGPSGR